MTPEVLYTTIIFSLSIGFFSLTFMVWIFSEDRVKYWVTGLAFLSIVITFLIETPHLAFAPIQILAIPIGSAIAFGLFAFLVYQYLKAKYPY